MKKFEVQYLDNDALGAVFMIFVTALNPYKAFLHVKYTLGYKPILIKECMGSL
jgi:hypothetical protein